MSNIQSLCRSIHEQHQGTLAEAATLHLPGRQRPWTDSGVSVRRGQAYSLIADGRIRWSKHHPGLHGGPGFHLWARVFPGGRIVNVTRNSGSFSADVDGRIELGIYLGAWRDAYGALDTPDAAYQKLDGALEVCVLSWHGTAHAAIEQLAAVIADPLLEAERARLAANVLPPDGWDYLVETGTSDVFRPCGEHGAPHICLDANDDQGIIRKPVDCKLIPGTTLAWRWRLLEHPSRLAEDTVHTHDYVSVAAEFDNGRDLTWIWSSTLPPEYYFDCPIKAWQARETHYVVRSGHDASDAWHCERRSVHADVSRAMGAPPGRIVALWLIVVASFQHGRARAEVADIVLSDGAHEQRLI